MRSLLALVARRYASWTITWLVIVGGLVLGTLPSYASTYPDEAARRAAVELAQRDAATTLLYGRLPDPGSPGQLFAWKIGAFLTLLVAVLGVLMAVRLSRTAEQDGTIELLRSAGLGRLAPLTATFAVLGVVGALLGLVSAAGVGFRAGEVEGADWTGSLAFGSVVALTFVLMALVTVVLARVFPTGWSARVAGALALAGCYALRALADNRHHAWLNRITPLGLRATVGPFTSDSPGPLIVSGVVVFARLRRVGVGVGTIQRARRKPGTGLDVEGSPGQGVLAPRAGLGGCRAGSSRPSLAAEIRSRRSSDISACSSPSSSRLLASGPRRRRRRRNVVDQPSVCVPPGLRRLGCCGGTWESP